MQKLDEKEKKLINERNHNDEDKKVKKNKHVNENNESFLTNQSQDERETTITPKNSHKIYAATYPVDEKANERNYYPCYACHIF